MGEEEEEKQGAKEETTIHRAITKSLESRTEETKGSFALQIMYVPRECEERVRERSLLTINK